MSKPKCLLTSEQHMEIAAEMHMLVRDRLAEISGAGPQLEEIGQIMACAFGDICGLLAINGLGAQIPVLNARAEQSAQKIIRSLAEASCEGSA